jgi:hypothetical protein
MKSFYMLALLLVGLTLPDASYAVRELNVGGGGEFLDPGTGGGGGGGGSTGGTSMCPTSATSQASAVTYSCNCRDGYVLRTFCASWSTNPGSGGFRRANNSFDEAIKRVASFLLTGDVVARALAPVEDDCVAMQEGDCTRTCTQYKYYCEPRCPSGQVDRNGGRGQLNCVEISSICGSGPEDGIIGYRPSTSSCSFAGCPGGTFESGTTSGEFVLYGRYYSDYSTIRNCRDLNCGANSTQVGETGRCACNVGFSRPTRTINGDCEPIQCMPNATLVGNDCICDNGYIMNTAGNACMQTNNCPEGQVRMLDTAQGETYCQFCPPGTQQVGSHCVGSTDENRGFGEQHLNDSVDLVRSDETGPERNADIRNPAGVGEATGVNRIFRGITLGSPGN